MICFLAKAFFHSCPSFLSWWVSLGVALNSSAEPTTSTIPLLSPRPAWPLHVSSGSRLCLCCHQLGPAAPVSQKHPVSPLRLRSHWQWQAWTHFLVHYTRKERAVTVLWCAKISWILPLNSCLTLSQLLYYHKYQFSHLEVRGVIIEPIPLGVLQG